MFMLWRNEPSIIIGKHQNPLTEINFDYVKKHEIPVIRRISGGGTVYQDLGNLNYTFIVKGVKDKLVDYPRYTAPIADFLRTLGLTAKLINKSDLVIDGMKISGNAEHVHKTKVLHHGTLLYSTSLEDIQEALKVHDQDKSVHSVRSRKSITTNIINHMEYPIDILAFKDSLFKFIFNQNKDNIIHTINQNDKHKIDELIVKKYNTWEWNYGRIGRK
jgi:lipoate-protein ligase A